MGALDRDMLNASLEEAVGELSVMLPANSKGQELELEVSGADHSEQDRRIQSFIIEKLNADGFRFVPVRKSPQVVVRVDNYGVDYVVRRRWFLFIGFYSDEVPHVAKVSLHVTIPGQVLGDVGSVMRYESGKIVSASSDGAIEKADADLLAGRYASAATFYEKAIKAGRNPALLPKLLFNCAIAYESAGEIEKAKSKYQAVLIKAKQPVGASAVNHYAKYAVPAQEALTKLGK